MKTQFNRFTMLLIVTTLIGVSYTNFKYKAYVPGIALVLGILLTSIHKDNSISHHTKTKKPWFIFWFILASLSVTLFPSLQAIGTHLKELGESFFIVALFLIGYNVSFSNLKLVGTKVLFQALSLWIIVSILVILALKTSFLN